MKSNQRINNQRIQVFKFECDEDDEEMTHSINEWIENLDIEIKILNTSTSGAFKNSSTYFDGTILFLTYEIINNGK